MFFFGKIIGPLKLQQKQHGKSGQLMRMLKIGAINIPMFLFAMRIKFFLMKGIFKHLRASHSKIGILLWPQKYRVSTTKENLLQI